MCQTCSDFSPVSCGSECASPVDRPGLHCGVSLGASLHDSLRLQGPGLSGTGALVIMAILSPQQLVSHWCVGWEEGPHETGHVGDWTLRWWVGGASFLVGKNTLISHLFKIPKP